MKRFTDTGMWQPWFRSLPGSAKLFWFFILHFCDHAGVWERDDAIAKVYVGEDLDVEESIKMINIDRKRIDSLRKGSHLFVIDFIKFQYGFLRRDNKTHVPVYKSLYRYGLDPIPYEGPYQEDSPSKTIDSPSEPILRLMDKDKDKVIDKDKVKEKINEIVTFWNLTSPLPKVVTVSGSRLAHFKARMENQFFFDNATEAIKRIASSDFCRGKNDRQWRADIDWFVSNDNVISKIMEGKYDNRKKSSSFEEDMRKMGVL